VKDAFVARQPIFDARYNIHGYELLYRADPDADSAVHDRSHAEMSSKVIVDSIIGIGLPRLTGGATAYINIPEVMLLEGIPEVLNPKDFVLELLESVRPTPEVLAACSELKEKGFRLAMDDFVFRPEYSPLLSMADVVKVDVLDPRHDLAALASTLQSHNVTLLAEKVENREVHDRCEALGFELFQGFHYFRPETMKRKDMAADSVALIRLLNLIKDINATDRQVEDAFRSSPGLTYKLLRIVNSAAMGGRGIDSITHAMRLLGRDHLYRWMSLLLLTMGGGGGEMRTEMIKSALIRGRMCELLGDGVRSARVRDVPAGGTLFLVGLFSHLDALIGVDIEEIVDELDLSQDVRDALLLFTGKAGILLRTVLDYADAEWDSAEGHFRELGGDVSVLSDLYLDSLTWAGDRMSFHEVDS